ncbi:hypothetical protein EJB05_57568, partial [Eragrostis curvula]
KTTHVDYQTVATKKNVDYQTPGLFPASGRSPATDALAVSAVALLSSVSGRPVAGFVDGPQTELVVPAALCLSSPQCCAAGALLSGASFRFALRKSSRSWSTTSLFSFLIKTSATSAVPSQNSERLWGAVPHVDVHVHPARTQQCWVQPLPVIRGEDDDPLLPTCRPQPINEVNAAVNVFNNKDGSVAHTDKKSPEVRVAFDLGQLKIVYVKLEVIGHCCDEAGLAGSRRPIQQVSPLPCPADPHVVVLPLDKPLKVVHDGLFQLLVHGERVKSRGVAKVDCRPGVVLNHVHLEVSVLVLHCLGRFHDEREVRVECLVLVPLVEADLEALDLVAAPDALGTVGAGAAGRPGCGSCRVVAGDKAPGVLDAVVDVHHLLALLHADHDALRLVDAADAEARHVGADPGGEVGARGVVDLVGGEALGLVDDDGVARGDAGAQVARARAEQVPQEIDKILERHIGVIIPHQNLSHLCRIRNDSGVQYPMWMCMSILPGRSSAESSCSL